MKKLKKRYMKSSHYCYLYVLLKNSTARYVFTLCNDEHPFISSSGASFSGNYSIIMEPDEETGEVIERVHSTGGQYMIKMQ